MVHCFLHIILTHDIVISLILHLSSSSQNICCVKPVKQLCGELDLGDTSTVPNPKNSSIRLDFQELVLVIFGSCLFMLCPDEMP
jgi:hypothetical protein